MENIEIGEYGRTNFGKIIRFAWLENSEGKKYENKVLLINDDILSNDFYYFYEGEKIVKHSKQLIDLIKVGDIVNGYRILEIYEPTTENEERILDIGYGMAIFNNEIKTILTKEQYEANCYKKGGEDE